MSAEHAHAASEFDNPTTHHETSDASVRGVFGFAIALATVTTILLIAVWLLLRFYERGAAVVNPAYTVPQVQEMPPMPRLQTNPRQDLRDLRAQEDAILSTYGWSDKNAGAVRIPIEDAMKLTVQRGLPARNTPEPAGPMSSGDSNSGRLVGLVQAARPQGTASAGPVGNETKKPER